MKKKLIAFLCMIAAVLMSAFPAYANAPVPIPESVTLTIIHPELLKSVRMVLYDENGADLHEETDSMGNPFERAEEAIALEIAEEGKGRDIQFYFMNGGLKDFAFEFTLSDGEVITTEKIEVESTGYHKYVFNAKTGKFKAGSSGSGGYFVSNCFSSLSFALIFLIPCGFTILIEWLISLIFRLKPGKIVVLTNLGTNLIMNFIISIICGFASVNYYVVVIIAEIIVMGIEFLVYALAYKNQPKWKLLIYTIVANIASWGLYTAALMLFT